MRLALPPLAPPVKAAAGAVVYCPSLHELDELHGAALGHLTTATEEA